MKKVLSILFLVAALARPATAGTVIGNETLIPLPSSALWPGIINLQPGTNEVVALNPPIFSWFYSPTNPAWAAYDKSVYQYQFQASYQPDFSSLIFDIRTYSDCYNFLAPFTSSPVYWRVAYLTTNSPVVTNSWITNVFAFPGGSTNGVKQWDRHYLGDTNYVNGIVTSHPYFWLNAANQAAMGTFFRTSRPDKWAAITNAAQTALGQTWWDNGAWGTTSLGDGEEDARGHYINTVAFVWMLTGDGHWTNGLINTYSNLVTYHQAASRWQRDYSANDGDDMLRAIIVGYDWLYPMLNNQIKTNAISAQRKIVRGNLYDLFWFSPADHSISTAYGNGDSTSEYPGPYEMPSAQAPKVWASHPKLYNAFTWEACLPIINDDPDARLLFDLEANYLIGKMTPWGQESVNRGRAYGYNETFNEGTISTTLLLDAIFPQMAMTNNPALLRLADWWLRMVAPGYMAPSDAEGITTIYATRDWWRRPWIGYDLAYASGDGDVVTAIRGSEALYGAFSAADPYWTPWISSFYSALPPQTTNSILSAVFPTSGFVVGSQYAPGTAASFSNGVSFTFEARPMGSEMDHTRENDLELEIFAYGASLTANQSGSGYASPPTWMNNTILINGSNQVQTGWGPRVETYGKIIAFTNGPDFVYCVGDARACYPHSLFPADPSGGTDNPVGFFSSDANFAMPYVSKAQRHVLFPHRKYIVLYDDVATTNSATFQWLWHTLGTNRMGSGGSFDYTVHPVVQPEITYPNTNVVVHVFQVVNSASVAVTNMSGTDVYKNPYMNADLSAYATYDGVTPMANCVWLTNLTPTNQFHFMTVIFPVKPGNADPDFTRINDSTVSVALNDGSGLTDTVTFNNTTPATFSVDLTGGGGGGSSPAVYFLISR